MRPNNPNKRLRGRNRSKNTNPLARSYESNGPDVKIRGSALQVADKYAQLARDSQSSGDRIMAENYLQHAEHYYRIVATAYEQQRERGDRRDDERGERRDDERRDDERSPSRFDERGGNRFDDRQRGEQPSINGWDGMDDDDDGVRRTMRANGNDRGDRSAERGAGRADERAADERAADDGPAEAEAEVETAQAEVNGNNGHAAEALSPQPEQQGEDDAKPKRRRAARPRRRRADGEGETVATAQPEASEPTN